MSFEHACFISYSHGDNQVVNGYIRQLQNALDGQLETYFKKADFRKNDNDCFYFIDKDRINSGTIVDTKIATALFDSVCMLVAYWPAYERSDYCLREFHGMKEIERLRREHCLYPDDTECLIVPILFKYGENKPTIFSSEGLDVSKLFLATGDISLMNEFWNEIDKICIKIKKHFEELTANKSNIKKLFKQRMNFALPNVAPRQLTRKKSVLMSRKGK